MTFALHLFWKEIEAYVDVARRTKADNGLRVILLLLLRPLRGSRLWQGVLTDWPYWAKGEGCLRCAGYWRCDCCLRRDTQTWSSCTNGKSICHCWIHIGGWRLWFVEGNLQRLFVDANYGWTFFSIQAIAIFFSANNKAQLTSGNLWESLQLKFIYAILSSVSLSNKLDSYND